jgi:DNA repair exonuclease SbcCD nuclease subunit
VVRPRSSYGVESTCLSEAEVWPECEYTMRFIHSSDWQIGKVFRFVDAETMAVLQEARLDAIGRLSSLAREQGAAFIVAAGDIFDQERSSDKTLQRALARMAAAPSAKWFLLPGNHDPHRPNGLWDRVARLDLPSNIQLLLDAKPISAGEGLPAWLLPAPLTSRQSLDDITAWMDEAPTPDGNLRIGVAHGSVIGFTPDETQLRNPIDPRRSDTAGLAYLALGDWHGAQEIGPRCWYSGTPETDAFRVEGGGQALVIEVEGVGSPARVVSKKVGVYDWHRAEAVVQSSTDIDALQAKLLGLGGDASRNLIELTVSGTLSLIDRTAFDERIRNKAGAAFRHLGLRDADLRTIFQTDDLDTIDHAGFVRAAAERLRAMAVDSKDAKAETATLALQRLFLFREQVSR